MNRPIGMGFPDDERRFLLAQPGIGPTVLARLEVIGIHSLAALQLAGVNAVVATISQGMEAVGWANRRKALARALLNLSAARRLDPACGSSSSPGNVAWPLSLTDAADGRPRPALIRPGP